MSELEALIILNSISGLGNMRIKKLIEYFGSAKKVLSLKVSDLKASHIVSQKIIENIMAFPQENYLKDELKLIASHEAYVISYRDDEYPENLKQIDDAPVILYVKGNLKNINKIAISIVGSRNASFYGLSVAEKFSAQLAGLGISVVSGMARGIDTAAHRGALKCAGMTVAVLGCGLGHIYPPENTALFRELTEKSVIFSEFPMEMPPFSYNFPRRNRIISGLSLGVIVIEAAKNSGALITCDFALQQGREVFAVPGPVDSPNSLGVHNLIKQGAKLINSVEDVLEELAIPIRNSFNEKKDKFVDRTKTPKNQLKLNDIEEKIVNFIKESSFHIDKIACFCNRSIAEVLPILSQLEIKGLIKQLPGKQFVANG